MRARIAVVVALVIVAGCGMAASENDEERLAEQRAEWEAAERERIERVIDSNLERISAYADSIEAAMRPVPLLTAAQEAAFNRYGYSSQLGAARRLGIPQPVTQEAIDEHLGAERLVQLEDNEYWVLREMDYSMPLVTPDVEALLTEIGERFHVRLDEHGLPPLRLEITSGLRSAQNQRDLRQVNPNAATSESAHQYGTTVDVTYASFRAPQNPVVNLDTSDAPWLESRLRRMEAMAAETGASRMSRELQAILGHVLREMQNEGKVMVTLEVRQPVYHMTVAQALAS